MEEMRVQIEAREPTDGEIRAFWFTLPIDTEQVEELLGIDIDTDYYTSRARSFLLLMKCRKIPPWKSSMTCTLLMKIYPLT